MPIDEILIKQKIQNKRGILKQAVAILLLFVLTAFPAQIAQGADGTINGILQQLEYDTTNGATPDIIHITNNIYAVVYEAQGDDGTVQTFSINSKGQFSTVDSLEYDTSNSDSPDIVHVSGNVYAVAYTGGANDGFVTTFTIDSSGNVGNSTIDSLEFDTNDARNVSLVNVTGNVYAVAYNDGSTADGFLATFTIETNGAISNAIVDSWEFDATRGEYPDMIAVGTDKVAIAYEGSGGSSLVTITIDGSGNITKSFVDSLSIGTVNKPDIINVSGTMYAIAYEGSQADGFVSTITISSAGDIGASFTDTLEFDTGDGTTPSITFVKGNVYAIAYEGPQGDGWLATVDIATNGTIANSIIDSFEYDSSDGDTPTIAYQTDYPYVVVAHTSTGTDGFIQTIEVEGAAPAIQFTSTSSSGSESTTSVNIEVSLSRTSTLDTTADYAVTGGTATGSGTDYTLASGTATIDAGNSTTNISVTINNDSLDEDNETIIITLSSPGNAILGSNTTHTYTITDNDASPTIQFTSTSSSGSESTTSVNIEVSLSAVSGRDVSVDYSATGGTATGSGTDYTLADGTVTVSEGNTTANISLTIVNDEDDEDDETVEITISDPTNATLGANTVHTYTITDDDEAASVLSQSAYRFFANSDSTDVGASLAAQDSAATSPAQGTPFRLRMLMHVATTELAQSGENFKLQIAERSGTCDTSFTGESYSDLSPSSGAIRFYDNSTPSDGSSLTSNANDTTHSGHTVVNQTYEEQNNFTNSQAAIPAGQDGRWDFTLVDNSAVGATTYCLRMVKSDGSTLDSYDVIPQFTTANPTVEFSTISSSGSESTTSVNLEVAVSVTSVLDVTVNYSATGGTATGSGTDYTLADGTATISAGSTSTNVLLTIENDALDEDNETIEVTLSSPTNATLGSNSIHTYTITDDDAAPSVEFTQTSSSGSESTTSVSLEVSLSEVSGKTVTVNYSATGGTATGSGTDYTLADGTATISAGNSTTNISITVVDDSTDESNETIEVTISSPSNATLGSNTVHTYTITDNDEAATEEEEEDNGTGTTGTGGGTALPPAPFVAPANIEIGVSINDGAQTTIIRSVTLSLNGGPNASSMIISNSPDFPNAGIEPYATKRQWILSEGEGVKTVYVRFYNSLGNISATVRDSIEYKLPVRPQQPPAFPIQVPQQGVTIPKPPVSSFSPPPIPQIPNIIEPLFPGDSKEETPIEEVSPEDFASQEIPEVFLGTWNLFPEQPVRQFVLAPLPSNLEQLAQKVPEIENLFEKLGISRAADVQKLRQANIILPGFNEVEEIPTGVVFAQGVRNIDLNATLRVTREGGAEQRISTLAGKPLILSIKPTAAAKQVRGLLVLRQGRIGGSGLDIPTNGLLASALSALAQGQDYPIEEELVLQEFFYTDDDNDGVYTAEIETPVVDGEYDIITIVEYDDPELGTRAFRLVMVIDPEGYIYTQSGENETRIAGAKVTLWWNNPSSKAFEVWPGREYRQTNPQTTDATGSYAFLVPEGQYRISVEAKGYKPYEGELFNVTKGNGVHANIRLYPNFSLGDWVNWKIFLGILIVAGMYLFFRGKFILVNNRS